MSMIKVLIWLYWTLAFKQEAVDRFVARFNQELYDFNKGRS